MTEAEARAALAAFGAVGGLERWIADQRWEAVPGGWRVRERFQDKSILRANRDGRSRSGGRTLPCPAQ